MPIDGPAPPADQCAPAPGDGAPPRPPTRAGIAKGASAGGISPGDAVVRLSIPAKVNLALHILGRRADGYHDLQSVVAFAHVADGDEIAVRFGAPSGTDGPNEGATLEISGPFAGVIPAGSDNAVLAAARLCPEVRSIHLTKGLPVAAGLGGGSADAAGVLRAAALHRGIDPATFAGPALAIGADVPVCLDGRTCVMEGIGEIIRPVPLPAVHGLLLNPGVPLSTPSVFRNLTRRDNPPFVMPPLASQGELFAWLRETRNDLEAPARAALPEIDVLLGAVAACEGCALARMSGSGPTVFGLFEDAQTRDAALVRLSGLASPRWWLRSARFGASSDGPATWRNGPGDAIRAGTVAEGGRG